MGYLGGVNQPFSSTKVKGNQRNLYQVEDDN